MPWVKKVCTSLGKKNRLRPRVALSLQNIIRESERLWLTRSMPIERWTAPQGAWFLLSEVSAYVTKSVEWEFLHHYWQLLDKNADGGGTQSFSVENIDLFDGQNSIESDSTSWASDRVFLLQTISNVSLELPSGPAADLAQKLLKRIKGFDMHSTEVFHAWHHWTTVIFCLYLLFFPCYTACPFYHCHWNRSFGS